MSNKKRIAKKQRSIFLKYNRLVVDIETFTNGKDFQVFFKYVPKYKNKQL